MHTYTHTHARADYVAVAAAAAGDEGSLRAQDGPTPWSGRLEVCVGRIWGSICDEQWGWDAARVACRQLLGAAADVAASEAIAGGFVPAAADSMPIHLSQAACLGNETMLTQCASTPARLRPSGKCSHRFDAGVICLNKQVRYSYSRHGARTFTRTLDGAA